MKDEAIIKRNRRAGFMILGAVFIPMLIAYAIFKTGFSLTGEGSSNGIIISPVQAASELEVKGGDAISSLYQPGEAKRWRMLVPVTEPCLEACEKRLYLSRQAHRALGQKSRRVERILLFLQPPTPEAIANLKQQHPRTLHVNSSLAALEAVLEKGLSPELKAAGSVGDNVYLIDQKGWLMMAYLPNNSGKDMLDDMKKLLRLSYEK